jgi:hypothetical protein
VIAVWSSTFHQDGLAGQQRGTPAEAGREGDFGVLDLHQRVEDELVEGAVEVAAAVQRAFGDGQLLASFDS